VALVDQPWVGAVTRSVNNGPTRILEGVSQCFMPQSCPLRQGHKPKVVESKLCEATEKRREKETESSSGQEERQQGFTISSLKSYMRGDEYLSCALCYEPFLPYLGISYPNSV
jgi:hypothetical protein